MNKKALIGLGLGAVIITLILVLYFFYPGGAPQVGPGKPAEPIKDRTIADLQEKPAPAGPTAPAPQEQAQPPLPEQVGPPGKPSPKPEVSPPAPKETVLPAAAPQEKYGLLAGRYRNYRDAEKMVQKLKKQGQPAFIRWDKGKYQVWLGPFPTRQEAKAAAKSLKGKIKISLKIEKLLIPVPK